jgi:hypothetical protein
LEAILRGRLEVVECDAAVLRAAGGIWPATAAENRRLVVAATVRALAMRRVVYLTSWLPTELLVSARQDGFIVARLDVPRSELERRNRERVEVLGHRDMAHWFDEQLANHDDLASAGLIDVVVDASRPLATVAAEIAALAGAI